MFVASLTLFCFKVMFFSTLFFSCRPQYYKLIEECISQIVLHRGGIDPDFASKRMEIDVEPLIGELMVLTVLFMQPLNVGFHQ